MRGQFGHSRRRRPSGWTVQGCARRGSAWRWRPCLSGDGEDRHVTAESLYAASCDSGEKVSLATVYNTLRAFCEVGLMREITVDGSKSYFDTNTTNHPHFYWEDSAALTDAPTEELEIARLPEAPDGAEISKVDVVIRLRKR